MSEEMTDEFMRKLMDCSNPELRDRIPSHATELRTLDADLAIVEGQVERRRARRHHAATSDWTSIRC